MFENVDLMTAIITPFTEDGSQINYDALDTLIERMLETGSKGFVVGGTTGETPTLTHDEKLELYRHFAKQVNGRVPVIAGVGSNNTAETISFDNEVAKIDGISAALVVVPYYNKPNQRCMIAHFTAVEENTSLPIIMYNIPGRTGVTMNNDTIVELSKLDRIAGVKQCTDMADLEYLVQHTADDFAVYSGEDAQALFAKTVGANGVISVASHIYGSAMRQMYDALDAGNVKLAGKLQCELTPRMAALFMYPSPSPVKAVLNAQGYQVGSCRLPISSLNDDEKKKLATNLELPEDALLKTLTKEVTIND